MKPVRDWIEYLVVRLFICFMQSFSLETCDLIARGLAWLAVDVLGVRGKLVEENLSSAYPQLSAAERKAMARGMWRHLLLMVCEIAHAPRKIHDTTWRRYVRFAARREQLRGMMQLRPKLVVTGHFGNFEIAGYVAGLWGFPTFTVARTLDNPHLEAFVRRFREVTGQFILPKQGSSGDVDAVLKAGGLLCLLGDQHAGEKGCWVDFFGRPASCHKALPLFALERRADDRQLAPPPGEAHAVRVRRVGDG